MYAGDREYNILLYPEAVMLEAGLECSEKMSDEKVLRKEVLQKGNMSNALHGG